MLTMLAKSLTLRDLLTHQKPYKFKPLSLCQTKKDSQNNVLCEILSENLICLNVATVLWLEFLVDATPNFIICFEH